MSAHAVVVGVGTAALAGWLVGVAGAFGVTTNWTLFLTGVGLLLVARLRQPR
jgi:hypothetical protein